MLNSTVLGTTHLLLAGVRSEELPLRAPLQRLLADLRRHDQLIEIELEPLTQTEAAAVARDVAGRQFDRAEAGFLVLSF